MQIKRQKQLTADFAELPLANSVEKAFVDPSDFVFICNMRWKLCRRQGTRYVVTRRRIAGRLREIKLHRLVMNAPENMEVHHINFNPLDNRKENLQICTREQHLYAHGKTIKPKTQKK